MATTYVNIGGTTPNAGATTVNLTAYYNLVGNNPGESVDYQLFNPNSPCVVQALILSSGNNTINATSCPAITNAGGVILIPPTSNIQTLTVKGVTGDAGIPISPNAPFVYTFTAGSPPTSFVLNAGGGLTILLAWF